MHRFFVNSEDIQKQEIVLVGDNAVHGNVLRLRMGEEIVTTVCSNGVDHICAVTHLSKSAIRAEIKATTANITELPVKVTLFQALPKGSKMDDIIEHVTELGIHSIVPIITARCIATPKSDKIARWQRIAESAAKLSHRGHIPKIGNILTLDEAISSAKNFDTAFACYELEKSNPLTIPKSNNIAFFIGPEGGFTPEEADLFNENNIPAVSLGARILRTQSAAAMVMACVGFATLGLDI